MRGTTLICRAITRKAFMTSEKVLRYNGRRRHSLLKILFGMPLANVLGNAVPHLSSTGSFLYAISFLTSFGQSVFIYDRIIAYIIYFVNMFFCKKREGHALPAKIYILCEGEWVYPQTPSAPSKAVAQK